MEASRPVTICHSSELGATERADFVVVEEPLEIRIDGHPVAVVMRTPGNDQELAVGFLISEGIIGMAEVIREIKSDPEANRLLIFLHENAAVDLTQLSRHLYAASSCGICGKKSLDAIFCAFPPIARRESPARGVLLALPARLRAGQPSFATTGGLHAAGLFDEDGNLLCVFEDVGRHNAVDKVIGHALMNQLEIANSILLVSGRVSFEIMQKALAARIPTIAAISAPSSLAVDFAKSSGQRLIGFLRPPSYNDYSIDAALIF